MIDLPIKFDQLVKMPGDGGGTGYPYRISARDLMTNFEYAALDADDSWIESTGTSTGQGRKLKLPALPGGGSNVLSSEGGDPQWIDKDDFLKDLQDQIDALVVRLDLANITAQCANGNVEVTLNI